MGFSKRFTWFARVIIGGLSEDNAPWNRFSTR